MNEMLILIYWLPLALTSWVQYHWDSTQIDFIQPFQNIQEKISAHFIA